MSDVKDKRCVFCGMPGCGSFARRDNGTGFVERSDKCRMYEAMGLCVRYKDERDLLHGAVVRTLEENRHLADGPDCTLQLLKEALARVANRSAESEVTGES